MGRIAADLADDIILTDDNPRTEDPARIVADILAGISGDADSAGGAGAVRGAGSTFGSRTAPVVLEHDRALAIRMALQLSGPDDVVLIAGKGHEDYQIYGKQRRPFVDQAIVTATLEGRRV